MTNCGGNGSLFGTLYMDDNTGQFFKRGRINYNSAEYFLRERWKRSEGNQDEEKVFFQKSLFCGMIGEVK